MFQHRTLHGRSSVLFDITKRRLPMNQIIYIVGLVVIVLAILSFFGFR